MIELGTDPVHERAADECPYHRQITARRPARQLNRASKPIQISGTTKKSVASANPQPSATAAALRERANASRIGVPTPSLHEGGSRHPSFLPRVGAHHRSSGWSAELAFSDEGAK